MIAKFIKSTLVYELSRWKKFNKMHASNPSTRLFNVSRFENQADEKTTDPTPVAVSEIAASDIRKTINGSLVIIEGTYQGKPIRVRIFNEPIQKQI